MSATETIPLTRILPKKRRVLQTDATDHAFVKKLIWFYFILLAF